MANTRKKRAASRADAANPSQAIPSSTVPPAKPMNATPTGGGMLLGNVLARTRAIIEESRHLLLTGNLATDAAWLESRDELVKHIDDHLPKLNDAITVIDEAAGIAGDTAELNGGAS
jgi:hypothetical protein